MLKIQTIILFVFLPVILGKDVFVDTIFGPIQGFTYQMADGKNANIFLGVPFASPPIGTLKLEKPIPPEPWEKILETKKFPKKCVPHTAAITKWVDNYSEDCLYLNIFAPSESSPDFAGYPLIAAFPGGGFCFGSTEPYGYKVLSDNFVSKGIIIVTIQYRLGPFGFFSTGDHVAPGNIGLWDQREALNFLHQVLADFNGDKRRITVWGHSAGGTSTSLLSASPFSRDLFAQAFQMSGSTFVEWGNSKRVIGVSRHLAKDLGCPDTSHSRTLKDCVKNKTTEEILAAADNLGLSRNDLNFDWYHPVADVEWFGKDYQLELEDSPRKPTLIGVTSAESLLCSAYIPDSLATMFSLHMGVKKEDQSSFSQENLEDFIKTRIATVSAFGDDANEAFTDLKKYYVERGTQEEKQHPRFYFNRYTDLLGDIQFTIPVVHDGLAKSRLGWPTFIYLFDWVNPQLAKDNGFYNGANHGLELAYLHGNQIFTPFEFTPADHKVKEVYVNGVANFFKYGNPSGVGHGITMNWPRMSRNHDFRYMHLAEEPTIRNDFFKHRLDFWQEFNRKYDFHLIRGEFKQSKKIKDEL